MERCHQILGWQRNYGLPFLMKWTTILIIALIDNIKFGGWTKKSAFIELYLPQHSGTTPLTCLHATMHYSIYFLLIIITDRHQKYNFSLHYFSNSKISFSWFLSMVSIWVHLVGFRTKKFVIKEMKKSHQSMIKIPSEGSRTRPGHYLTSKPL